jgi:hypothetical protein
MPSNREKAHLKHPRIQNTVGMGFDTSGRQAPPFGADLRSGCSRQDQFVRVLLAVAAFYLQLKRGLPLNSRRSLSRLLLLAPGRRRRRRCKFHSDVKAMAPWRSIEYGTYRLGAFSLKLSQSPNVVR